MHSYFPRAPRRARWLMLAGVIVLAHCGWISRAQSPDESGTCTYQSIEVSGTTPWGTVWQSQTEPWTQWDSQNLAGCYQTELWIFGALLMLPIILKVKPS